MEAGHSGSVPGREEVRAGPSIEGGAWFVRARCQLRVDGDMSSGLASVLVPWGCCPSGPEGRRRSLGTVGPSQSGRKGGPVRASRAGPCSSESGAG